MHCDFIQHSRTQTLCVCVCVCVCYLVRRAVAITYKFVRAIQNGHEECAEFLIETGSMLQFRDSYAHTVLHWACYRGCSQLVKFLLNKGYLSIAVQTFLLSKYTHTHTHTHTHSHTLSLTCTHPYHSLTITMGNITRCDPTETTVDGDTALHAAAVGGDGEIVSVLVDTAPSLPERLKMM